MHRNNIADIVLKYRVHSKSISQKRKEEQQVNAVTIFLDNINHIISLDEARCVLRQRYDINPVKHSICYYKVFQYFNYRFIRNSIGYAYRYLKSRM